MVKMTVFRKYLKLAGLGPNLGMTMIQIEF